MSASLQIVEIKGDYHLELHDGAGSLRLARFATPLAMSVFMDLAKKGIKLADEVQR